MPITITVNFIKPVINHSIKFNINMDTNEIKIIDGKFEYLGKVYDCKYLIERDKKNILREADESHKDEFDELYDRDTLAPLNCRVYLDNNDRIVYVMIIYTVDYRDGKCKRTACGDYYPMCDLGNNKLFPHPYQASICW